MKSHVYLSAVFVFAVIKSWYVFLLQQVLSLPPSKPKLVQIYCGNWRCPELGRELEVEALNVQCHTSHWHNG